jgi:hypothetical protein
VTEPVRDSGLAMKFWVCSPCAWLGSFVGYGVSYFFQPVFLRLFCPLSEYYLNAPHFLWRNLQIHDGGSEALPNNEIGQALTRSLAQQYFVIAVTGIVTGTIVGYWLGLRILKRT